MVVSQLDGTHHLTAFSWLTAHMNTQQRLVMFLRACVRIRSCSEKAHRSELSLVFRVQRCSHREKAAESRKQTQSAIVTNNDILGGRIDNEQVRICLGTEYDIRGSVVTDKAYDGAKPNYCWL